jgi:hypothetical protein
MLRVGVDEADAYRCGMLRCHGVLCPVPRVKSWLLYRGAKMALLRIFMMAHALPKPAVFEASAVLVQHDQPLSLPSTWAAMSNT